MFMAGFTFYFDNRKPKEILSSLYSLHHFQSTDLPANNTRGRKFKVLHLCHEVRCCDVAHSNLEAHQIIMSRRFCMRTVPPTGRQAQDWNGEQQWTHETHHAVFHESTVRFKYSGEWVYLSIYSVDTYIFEQGCEWIIG